MQRRKYLGEGLNRTILDAQTWTECSTVQGSEPKSQALACSILGAQSMVRVASETAWRFLSGINSSSAAVSLLVDLLARNVATSERASLVDGRFAIQDLSLDHFFVDQPDAHVRVALPIGPDLNRGAVFVGGNQVLALRFTAGRQHLVGTVTLGNELLAEQHALGVNIEAEAHQNGYQGAVHGKFLGSVER